LLQESYLNPPLFINYKIEFHFYLILYSYSFIFEHDLFYKLSLLKGSMIAGALFYGAEIVFNCSVLTYGVSKITGIASYYKSETSWKRKLIDESKAGESSG
jgi:hypothetical protein